MSLFLFLHTSRSFLKREEKKKQRQAMSEWRGHSHKRLNTQKLKIKYERGMKNFTDLISVITTRRESSTLQSQRDIYFFMKKKRLLLILIFGRINLLYDWWKMELLASFGNQEKKRWLWCWWWWWVNDRKLFVCELIVEGSRFFINSFIFIHSLTKNIKI